jgi:hypothetical protein
VRAERTSAMAIAGHDPEAKGVVVIIDVDQLSGF